MERKRIGNDIKLRWAVFNPDGTPVDFTDKSVKVEIRNDGYAKGRYPQEFKISGNLIDLQFTAKEQQSVGVYNLWLEYTYPDPDTEGGIATVTLDNCGAFQLVSKTCELAGINEDPIYLEGIVTGLSYNNLTEENKDEITNRLLESGQFEVDQIIITRAEEAAEKAETAGVAYDCPECIIHARRGAREKINELESEIGDLELLQEEYLKTIDEMEL